MRRISVSASRDGGRVCLDSALGAELLGVESTCAHCLDVGEGASEHGVDREVDERLLAGDVPVDAAEPSAELRREAAQRQAGYAVAIEQLDRCVEDRVARERGARAAGLGHRSQRSARLADRTLFEYTIEQCSIHP